ncbi:hypothetical protein G6F24_015640 [Rhizopus arrhizus]|nr:hypothetical protein G6F24_015640 [Rhizopus arrhizus]
MLGKGLNKAGFTVHGVQLPGHCGTVDDLLATTWEQWYQGVEDAAAELRGKVDQLFVGGLSRGAVLSLALAARRPEWVSGVGVPPVVPAAVVQALQHRPRPHVHGGAAVRPA